MAEPDELARVIWEASRADESTISATGANVVARAVEAAGWGDLKRVAEWLVDVGYPVDFQFPAHPAPQPLWDAIVDVVHADRVPGQEGRMHGNELTRDEVDGWLSDEAGRPAEEGPPGECGP